MTNLFFLVVNPFDNLFLYHAADIFEHCDLDKTDKAGSFKVNIGPIPRLNSVVAPPHVWDALNEALFEV